MTMQYVEEAPTRGASRVGPWLKDKLLMGQPLKEYARGMITPLNVAAALLIGVALYLLVLRFTRGLAAVTSASNEQPWGLFLSCGLFAGVPLSATGFVLGSAVYLFGMKDYHPVVKNAILLGLLGYFFAVVFLLIDLGRPWRIYYPMVVSFGPGSVMFLVAWHVALYLSVQFLEFSPSIFEWLGLRSLKRWAVGLTIGLTIFGVILSTLHQSALGAMFLLAPGKLHPLWYSPYLPWLFFVSAIATGLCMVIVVSALTLRFFADRADYHYLTSVDRITLGLGKAASFVLLTYFAFKVISVAHGHNWALLNSSWGYWFLVEVVGFVLIPCVLLAVASREGKVGLVRFGALLTVMGVILNRLNVSLIAFNWNLPNRELATWQEVTIVVAVFTIEIMTYRWIVNRMPVLQEHLEYRGSEVAAASQKAGPRVSTSEVAAGR